ncbi:MAG: I78 family peptidase inhibitor [Burkholderiaceae bacterium]
MMPGARLAAMAAVAVLTMTALSACQNQAARASGSAGPGAAAGGTAAGGTRAGDPKAGVCDRNVADTLVGRAGITDDEARRLTGASIVRQIAPGTPVTLDFRRERVTIETDARTGKIVRAFCG